MNSKLFYESNKEIMPSFSAPDYSLDDNGIADWIFSTMPPYIELDIEFDVNQWKLESDHALKYLVNHREHQNHMGWKSCCIHGIDTDKSGIWRTYGYEHEPEYKWTELSVLTPTITRFWKQFPMERYARVRFMMVEPGGYVDPHNDTPPGVDISNISEHLIPINVAIDHPDNCYMTLKGHGIVPWKSGQMKIVNITNDHSVINMSDKPRMHMIAHGIIGNRRNEFNKLIASSYKKQYERYKI